MLIASKIAFVKTRHKAGIKYDPPPLTTHTHRQRIRTVYRHAINCLFIVIYKMSVLQVLGTHIEPLYQLLNMTSIGSFQG